MLARLWTFDHEIWWQSMAGQSAVATQCFDALADQGAELSFHVGCMCAAIDSVILSDRLYEKLADVQLVLCLASHHTLNGRLPGL